MLVLHFLAEMEEAAARQGATSLAYVQLDTLDPPVKKVQDHFFAFVLPLKIYQMHLGFDGIRFKPSTTSP